MQTQDFAQIKQILQMTLSPNQQQITQGETLLNQQSQQPNYAQTLVMITDDSSNDMDIRQSAVVNLKTFVEKYWKKKDGQFSLPDNEKAIIRSTIIDALIRCVSIKKLRAQYEDLMYKLVAIDYPQAWPELVPMIVSKLSSMQTFEEMYGTLLALRRVCENFQFLMDEDRQPLYPIVNQTFPILENLFQKSLENYNDQTGILVKIIMKTFHHCTHLELPDYIVNQQVIEKWFQFYAIILRSSVPPELLTPTFDDQEIIQRDKHYIWSNKKWASLIMQRFTQKFFNETFVKENQVEFSRYILKTYAPSFMETFFQLLLLSQNQFIAPKTSLHALKFLYYSLKLKFTKELLTPHLDKLLYDIAVPKMQLTPIDDKLWKTDPEEYIRKLDDFTIASYNIKNAANDLFQQVCQTKDAQGQDYLISYLQYCQVCFSTGVDPRTNTQVDLLKKEALFWGIESVSDKILKIESIKAGMETMLEKFILPELQNSIGFLRARACNLFFQFGSIEFTNKANIQNAVTGIYNCILDKELPVRVAAAQSFSAILSHEEAKEMVRPGLNKILEIYINLMNMIDNEHLVKSLEIIVQNFSNEISPFAEQLAVQLSNIFHKYCKKQNQGIEESDDDGEAELAAVGCLEAIKRILSSPLNKQSYLQLEQIIFPILNFCFTESGCDFVVEALELLNLLLYKQQNNLSPGLWFYYPVLAYIIIGLPPEMVVRNYQGFSEEQYLLLEGCKTDWGTEFLKNMIGCFRNYIQKGGDAFLTQNDMFGNHLVQLIFNMAQKFYQIGENGDDESDINAVTTLFVTLIENYKGKIDHLVEPILQIALGNLQKKKSKRFRVINYCVVLMLFWYNPQLTVSLMNKANLNDQFFQNLFENIKAFTNERDLHILFLGICTLYTLPADQLPNYLIANASLIGKQMARLTTDMLEMREEDESSDEEEEINAKDDAAYKNTIQQLQRLSQKNDDDDDDDYDEGEDSIPFESLYDSPTEEIDAILLFEQLLLNLAQQNPNLNQELTSQFTIEDRETLMKNIEEAKKQYQEWLSQKNK